MKFQFDSFPDAHILICISLNHSDVTTLYQFMFSICHVSLFLNPGAPNNDKRPTCFAAQKVWETLVQPHLCTKRTSGVWHRNVRTMQRGMVIALTLTISHLWLLGAEPDLKKLAYNGYVLGGGGRRNTFIHCWTQWRPETASHVRLLPPSRRQLLRLDTRQVQRLCAGHS
jgi:hypothetical protein